MASRRLPLLTELVVSLAAVTVGAVMVAAAVNPDITVAVGLFLTTFFVVLLLGLGPRVAEMEAEMKAPETDAARRRTWPEDT